jgi:hypothetical protein
MSEALEAEIETARRQVSAETISMTISELTNLYREGTLVIRPEFQRLYRWDNSQKSKLIESILLGIPLPSLFVAQTPEGKWELVDGLQRVSTLLELQGLLPDEDGNLRGFLRLEKTKFLPSLEGRTWEATLDAPGLSEAQRLDLRLARLDLKVLKRSSDPTAKFDLFQRLNGFGSPLTAQEIRSAMMAGTDARALEWVGTLANSQEFKYCVALSDRLVNEQYDLELVLRFLMLHDLEPATRSTLDDFSTRLDDWAISFASDFDSRRPELERVFFRSFDLISTPVGDDIFRKWNDARDRFSGAFQHTAYEVIAIGTGYLVRHDRAVRSDIVEAAKELSQVLSGMAGFATGRSSADRLARTLPAGRKLMTSERSTISAEDFR